jgi:hypothetical protein
MNTLAKLEAKLAAAEAAFNEKSFEMTDETDFSEEIAAIQVAENELAEYLNS